RIHVPLAYLKKSSPGLTEGSRAERSTPQAPIAGPGRAAAPACPNAFSAKQPAMIAKVETPTPRRVIAVILIAPAPFERPILGGRNAAARRVCDEGALRSDEHRALRSAEPQLTPTPAMTRLAIARWRLDRIPALAWTAALAAGLSVIAAFSVSPA